MKLSISHRSLTDKSKVWSVLITDDDGQTAEIHCLNETKAILLHDTLTTALEKATGRKSE